MTKNLSNFVLETRQPILPYYSLGDYLAISAQGTNVKFSTTIWGVLAILTDIVFRGLFLAYMFSIIKAKTFPLLGRVIY